jgi:hypothetical protein
MLAQFNGALQSGKISAGTLRTCEDYSRYQINRQLSASASYEDYADNSKKNISTTSPSTSSTAASTAAYHARGLAVAHSRKLLATLGGSTSTRPGVRKLTLKTYNFNDISNTIIPTTFGGLTTTSPPIVIVIL